MIINISDLLTSEGKVEHFQCEFEETTVDFLIKTYSLQDKSKVDIKITNVEKGKILVEGRFLATVRSKCDRCLEDTTFPLKITFCDEISEESIHNLELAEEHPYMKAYQLDTEVLIGNEILINWPTKVLCNYNCKGICNKCGKNLNLGNCDCDTFVPDPRMAVIKDIFNANKEV